MTGGSCAAGGGGRAVRLLPRFKAGTACALLQMLAHNLRDNLFRLFGTLPQANERSLVSHLKKRAPSPLLSSPTGALLHYEPHGCLKWLLTLSLICHRVVVPPE